MSETHSTPVSMLLSANGIISGPELSVGLWVVVKYGTPEWLQTEHGTTNPEYGTRKG